MALSVRKPYYKEFFFYSSVIQINIYYKYFFIVFLFWEYKLTLLSINIMSYQLRIIYFGVVSIDITIFIDGYKECEERSNAHNFILYDTK